MITFNKNIFICWFQGKSHLDNYHKSIIFNENIQNWQLLNPSWNVYLIDDQITKGTNARKSIEILQGIGVRDLTVFTWSASKFEKID